MRKILFFLIPPLFHFQDYLIGMYHSHARFWTFKIQTWIYKQCISLCCMFKIS